MKDTMSKRQELKNTLRDARRVFAAWTSFGHPSISEIFTKSGVDFVGIDIEHSTISQENSQRIIAACQARKALRFLIKTGDCDFLLRDNHGRLPSEMAYLYGEDVAVSRLLGNKERKQAEEQGIVVTRRPMSE